MVLLKRLVLGLLIQLSLAGSVCAQLEAVYEAHGGLEKWRSYGRLQIDVEMKIGTHAYKDHEQYDMVSRWGYIASPACTFGEDKDGIWIHPNVKALKGVSPQFYLKVPLHFFAMPFVFSDAGNVAETLGRKRFDRKEYDTVKITWPGTAGAPGDYTVAYVDPHTHVLKLACYTDTFAAKPGAKTDPLVPSHAAIFDKWQTDESSLLVPAHISLYAWANDATTGAPIGEISIHGPSYEKERPGDDMFQRWKGSEAVTWKKR